ncbi:hypothetical protein GCM10009642_35850 [Nocardiopsis metallicus]
MLVQSSEPLEGLVDLASVAEPLACLGAGDGALGDPAHPGQSFLGQVLDPSAQKTDHPLSVALPDSVHHFRVPPYPRGDALTGAV